jgi:hypothetical protein
MATQQTKQKVSEATLQHQVVYLLRTLGYTIMESGKGRSKQRCAKCGHSSYATGWQGNTVGLPDLYIHSIKWPRGVALAIEMKTQTGSVRKEQQELAEKGLVFICRSVGCVINALIQQERQLNNEIEVDTLQKVKDINGF